MLSFLSQNQEAGPVRGSEFDETLRISCVVCPISFLHPTRIQSYLPSAIEHDLPVHVRVDVAEVDGVEVLEEVLEADPEASVVESFSVELPTSRLGNIRPVGCVG